MYEQAPMPRPGAGEVLVRVHAAAPNRMQLADVARMIDAGELRPIAGAVPPLRARRMNTGRCTARSF